MQIISKLIQIEAKMPIDSIFIEKKLEEIDIIPLRWAIVKVESNSLTISVACESL